MKKINQLIAVFAIAVLTLVSCSEDDPVIQPVSYGIKANFGEAFNNKSISGIVVTLKNTLTSNDYNATTDAEGNVKFDGVNPGTYSITANVSFTKAQYENFFGITTTESKINFSGSIENVVINNASQANKTIVLKTSKIGNLLLKQIYYAGSNTKDGAGFRDLFFEVYNNSNEVIYADGLYFAQAYGRTTTSVKDYTLANGQFDWSKSINQTKGNTSNTNYCYADNVIKFPGTGKDYPINPGESLVVAATAINHKQPLTTPKRTYSVANPELTIDLSGADFEVNYIDYYTKIGKTTKILDTDIDNPNVPNMEIAYHHSMASADASGNKELILDPLGRDSFVIFRSADFDTYDKLPNPQSSSVTSRTKLFVQIPNSVIIDGVEVRRDDPAKATPRRLDTSIDGGQMFVSKGSYSSQAIIRKVSQTFGTRKVLQDTNNSENDFIEIDIPVPGGWN